jgi:hypothetical protein
MDARAADLGKMTDWLFDLRGRAVGSDLRAQWIRSFGKSRGGLMRCSVLRKFKVCTFGQHDGFCSAGCWW